MKYLANIFMVQVNRHFSSVGLMSRSERLEKRMEYLLTRESRKIIRRIEKSPETARLEGLLNIMKQRGFTELIDVKGNVTMSLIKSANTNNDLQVAIDFEFRIRTLDEIKLFDVILDNKAENSNKIVATCQSSPSFEILSIRIIPPNEDYLNQIIFDGPNLSNLSKEIQV